MATNYPGALVDQVTVLKTPTLQDVVDTVYKGVGSGGANPTAGTTPAAVLTNLGVSGTAEGQGADLVGNAIKRVPSIAALRALTAATKVLQVDVDSYYGDGTTNGGGRFLWSANATAPDDFGVTIVPTYLLATSTNETMGSGTGSATAFSGTFAHLPLQPGTLTVTAGTVTGIDDSVGNISGTGVSGTVNYATGAWSLTFTTAPSSGLAITGTYQYASANGRWIRANHFGFVLPEMFGAKSVLPGNTINDCTKSLNQAAYFCYNYNQAELHLLPLVYGVSGTGWKISPYGTNSEQNAPSAIIGSSKGGNGTIISALPGCTLVASMQNVSNTYLGRIKFTANNVSSVSTTLDTSWNVSSNPAPSLQNTYEDIYVDNTNTGPNVIPWLANANLDCNFIHCSIVGVSGSNAIQVKGAGGGVEFTNLFCSPGMVGVDVQNATFTNNEFVNGINILGRGLNLININGGQTTTDNVTNSIINIGSGNICQGININGGYLTYNGSNVGSSIIAGPGQLNATAVISCCGVSRGGVGANGIKVVSDNLSTSLGIGGNVQINGGYIDGLTDVNNSSFNVSYINVSDTTGGVVLKNPNGLILGGYNQQWSLYGSNGSVSGDKFFANKVFGITSDVFGEASGITSTNPLTLTPVNSSMLLFVTQQGGGENGYFLLNGTTTVKIAGVGTSAGFSPSLSFVSGSWKLTINTSSASAITVLYYIRQMAS